MNTKCQNTLEFNKVIELLCECCDTEGAKEAARSLAPFSDVEKVRRAQDETNDAMRLIMQKGAPSFGGVKNIHPALEKSKKNGVLSTRELLDTANVLSVSRMLTEYISTDKLFDTVLDEIFARIIPVKNLENEIKDAIVSEDIIADTASFDLADIRRKIKKANQRISELMAKYLQGGSYSKYLQENIATTRNGRFVLPVKNEYRNQIPGLVHDTSSSGATLFIEPMEIVQANNEIKELESREKYEIERILSELSARVASYYEELSLNYDNITLIAFIFGKAELGLKMNAAKPEINEEHKISLTKARHPLISQKSVVPISVSLGIDYNMLIITGPNTGGKTVSLKTIGLLTLMAQSGLLLPCDSASVCVFDEIYSDIGDEQSIEQSLSTFSSHMVNIIDIIDKVNDNSLVLLDELCSGTDPVEGAALAHSILEYILNSGALCCSTTHYSELKAYALTTDNVSNASCEFDVETLKPTYKLIIGTPGKSNAFAISQRLGLPEHIIDKAEDYLDADSIRFENVIEKLDEQRYSLESEKEKAADITAELEKLKTEEKEKLESKYEQIDNEIEAAKKEARKIIESARATSDYVLKELEKLKSAKEKESFSKDYSDTRKTIREKFKEYAEEHKEPDETDDYVLPRPLKKGDVVMHKTLKTEGTVLKEPDKNGTVLVQMGILKSTFDVSVLILVDSAAKKTESAEKSYRKTVSSVFKPTIDVRGMYADDAVDSVDKFIDEAIVAKYYKITILHGKGTGALRNAIWNALKKDKRIKNFRAGEYGEGDYGVTIVDIKEK